MAGRQNYKPQARPLTSSTVRVIPPLSEGEREEYDDQWYKYQDVPVTRMIAPSSSPMRSSSTSISSQSAAMMAPSSISPNYNSTIQTERTKTPVARPLTSNLQATPSSYPISNAPISQPSLSESNHLPVPVANSLMAPRSNASLSMTINGINVPVLGPVMHDFTKPEADIDDRQRKYCRCLLRVEAKGSSYSPYGVCTKSTHAQVHSCSQYYNFSVMDLDMLVAYMTLHKLDASHIQTREQALQAIAQWKSSRGEHF